MYTITSLWASQPGSLLLWLTVLAACGALVTYQNRNRNRELMPWVTAVIGGIMVFFASMTAFVSSPFEKVAGATPTSGLGLDPSLQNPYMAIHPPMLYLGYVSCAVPFAFAMAALVTGRTDARWLLSVRRWTLISWTALGIGMLLGAHWAYVEIGWGGYWAWDPVENAALMPWLAATAFLHSVMVQEKKGMLKVWNMALVSATFALALFGTFLTRSGIVNSIHSFVQSSVGPFLLGFIAVVLVFAASMIVWRLPLLRADHKLESVISREATFLFNNLLLLALVFAVIWGVVFPVLSEAARGVQSTVSSPYYNFFLVLFGLPLLLLIGIGPMIAWRRASPRSLLRTFRWPIASAAGGHRGAVVLRPRIEHGGAHGAVAVRLRGGVHRARVRARNGGSAGAFRRFLSARASRADRPQPTPIRRATWCTWRWCCWWSAWSPRVSTEAPPRHCSSRASRSPWTATRSPTPGSSRPASRTRSPPACGWT